MSNSLIKPRSIALYALTIFSTLFMVAGANLANAAALSGSSGKISAALHAADYLRDSDARIIRVHHRRKRWRRRRGRLHIHFGFPYYGGYYYRSGYRYCRRWRRRCAYRHGWRTRMWRRCMRHYGCRY